MATIALTGNTIGCSLGIGSFESLGKAFLNSKNSTGGLSGALGSLKNKIDIASIAVKVDTSQQQVKQADSRETEKKEALTLAYDKLDTLVSDVGVVDCLVSGKVNRRKEDFYKKYSYLKPQCEKTDKELRKEKWAERWQKFKDFWGGVGKAIGNIAHNIVEWCNSNIGKIVLGIVAVVGAILIIVAVVASGGLALVPLLTAWGLSAGLATAISLTVATVAVVSTSLALIPNTLDLAAAIDEVIDPEHNSISDFNKYLHSFSSYNTFQTSMNITSAVSGGIYSIGSMYNASKGITNADLKHFNQLQSEGYRPGFGSYGQEVNYLSDYYPGSDAGINRSLGQAEFYSVTNSNGGQIHVSTAPIDQYSFTDIVNNANGQVNILSGTHGDIDGMLIAEKQFLMEDMANWGSHSNIAVLDVTKLTQSELTTILNSNSTSICAWCYSERSVSVLKALGLM